MKKFFQVGVAIKELTALCYTATMCIYMIFLWMFEQETVQLSTLFSLLLVCIAAGTMQVAAFSDLLFKKLAYGWRLVVFAVPFGAVLTTMAVACGWFPTDQAGAWVTFGAVFVLIFVTITGGIELYYRLSGRWGADRLDWKKKNRLQY